MISERDIPCPNCGVMLPASGVAPGVLVQCSQCGKQFSLEETSTPQVAANSNKAVASLILGLIPIPLITGIPAIILGIWALLDIRRRAGQLRGSGMAACGILFGSLCTFVCTPLLGMGSFLVFEIIQSSNFTDDPEEAATIASKMVDFDLPEGLQAIAGADTAIIGWKMAVFGDRQGNPNTMIILMKFPQFMASSQKEMEQQMQQQVRQQQQGAVTIEDHRILTFNIRGEPVQVSEGIGKDPNTGRSMRQYMTLLADEGGPLMVMLITGDPPNDSAVSPDEDDAAVRLTEEQVKEFFESIK